MKLTIGTTIEAINWKPAFNLLETNNDLAGRESEKKQSVAKQANRRGYSREPNRTRYSQSNITSLLMGNDTTRSKALPHNPTRPIGRDQSDAIRKTANKRTPIPKHCEQADIYPAKL